MLDENTANSIVSLARRGADPFLDCRRYAESLVRYSLEAVGFGTDDIELLSLSDHEISLIASELQSHDNSLIVLDAASVFCLPAIVDGMFGNVKCAMTSEGQFYSTRGLCSILSAGLDGVSECFVGLVVDPVQVDFAAGYDSVFNLRRLVGDDADIDINLYQRIFNPILFDDSVWNAVSSLGNYKGGLTLWSGLSDRAYEDIYPVMCNMLDSGLPSFSGAERLSTAILLQLSAASKLPRFMKGWLLSWKKRADSYVGASIDLLDFSAQNEELFHVGPGWEEARSEAVVAQVAPVEIVSNRSLDASYFSGFGCVRVKEMTLKEMSCEIRRGASIAAKRLTFEDSGGKSPFENLKTHISNLGISVSCVARSANQYVDISDIHFLERRSWVSPRPIAQIPSGQDKYVVTSEDAPVVLIPRNGGVPAAFAPNAPTLVSNNLFFVKLKPGIIGHKYLNLALASWFVREQLGSVETILRKRDVEDLVIPMVDESVQDLLVDRNESLAGDIELEMEKIGLLRSADYLDVRSALRFTDSSSKRSWF